MYGTDELPANAKKTTTASEKTAEQQKAQKAGGILCSWFSIGCDSAATKETKKQEEARKQEEAKRREEEKKKGSSDPNCAIADSEECYQYSDDEAWKWKQKQREEELRRLSPRYTGSGDVDPPPEGAGERFVDGKAERKQDAPVDPPDDEVAGGPTLRDCSLAPGEGAIDPIDGSGLPPGADFSHCEQELPSFDNEDLSGLFGGDDDEPQNSKPRGDAPATTPDPITNQEPGGRPR